MSLNFDLKDVRKTLGEERYAVLTTSPDTANEPEGSQRWHSITDFMIWTSMAVDLGTVTEGNVDEWCFRVGLLHALSGPDGYDVAGAIGKFRVNRNDIVNHIGLRTNVTTKKRAAFLAKIFGEGAHDARKVSLKPTDEPSAAEQVNKAYAEYVAREAAKD